MRSISGILLIYALTLMLASASPTGVGQGVHQLQLVDEVLPHVHLVNGQRVEVSATSASATTQDSRPGGVALGAGDGAGAASAGGALLTPGVPRLASFSLEAERGVVFLDGLPPADRTEIPPDPPPLAPFWS